MMVDRRMVMRVIGDNDDVDVVVVAVTVGLVVLIMIMCSHLMRNIALTHTHNLHCALVPLH